MSNLRHIDRIYDTQIPVLKKVIIGSVLLVALAAIATGSYFHSVGALSYSAIGIGGTLFLLDVGYCIYLFREKTLFVEAVNTHQMHFPSERFASHNRAWDFELFFHGSRSYSVLYEKNCNVNRAYYFAEHSQLHEKQSELPQEHWVTPNAVN